LRWRRQALHRRKLLSIINPLSNTWSMEILWYSY
jgi:hypothetical protein